jgi:hypothetical protein
VWEDVLQIMSVIGPDLSPSPPHPSSGILTNCCLMLFTSTRLKQLFSFLGVGASAPPPHPPFPYKWLPRRGGCGALRLRTHRPLLEIFPPLFHQPSPCLCAARSRAEQVLLLTLSLSHSLIWHRILTQRKKVDRGDRLRRLEEDHLLEGHGTNTLPATKSFCSQTHSAPFLPRESIERAEPRHRRSSIRSESATYLAADPFDFQSENGDSPLPVNCISEINFTQFDQQQSKRSLSPLFELLRLKEQVAQPFAASLHPDLLSDSSSSDSESFSHKSIGGRYTLPRTMSHCGPGPATFGTLNQLRGGSTSPPRLRSKAGTESRRDSLQSESVTSFDENDEDCWRLQSLAQIDTLSSARKPLGENRIQCIVREPPVPRLSEGEAVDPTLKRCNTFDSALSSLTGPSHWPEDVTHSEASPSHRASLLQVPVDNVPSKPTREPRKASIGMQSASPSLRRGARATPPSNPRKSMTPESLPKKRVHSPQLEVYHFPSPQTASPLVANSSPQEKTFTPPSAPLPTKPESSSASSHRTFGHQREAERPPRLACSTGRCEAETCPSAPANLSRRLALKPQPPERSARRGSLFRSTAT